MSDWLERLQKTPPIHRRRHLSRGLGQFHIPSAAIIANLDLIVSVDTSVMHLAGTMGKPVWTLLGGETDWKFPIGDRNPFYQASLYECDCVPQTGIF
jgi:hypothetical protein